MTDKELLKKILRHKTTLGLLAGSLAVSLVNDIFLNLAWTLAFLYFYIVLLAETRRFFTNGEQPSAWQLGLELTWYSLRLFVVLFAVMLFAGIYIYKSGVISTILQAATEGAMASLNLEELLKPVALPIFGTAAVSYALTFAGIAVVLWQGNAKRSVLRSFTVLIRDFPFVLMWTVLILLPTLLHNPFDHLPTSEDIAGMLIGKMPERSFSLWPALNALANTAVMILAPIHLALRYGTRQPPRVPIPPPPPQM